MQFTWLGHACFLIETNHKRLITDPYSPEIGFGAVNEAADFVTISHDNPKWHSCLDHILGDFELIRGLNLPESGLTRGEIQFGAVEVFERLPDDGPNAMIWLESEGLRVLHTGDCGVLPPDDVLERCGRVDVLLGLAGGAPTLILSDLMVLVEKLAPKIVIPMHFGVPGLQMKALPVEELEKLWDAERVVRHAGSTLKISRDALPETAQLHILAPAR